MPKMSKWNIGPAVFILNWRRVYNQDWSPTHSCETGPAILSIWHSKEIWQCSGLVAWYKKPEAFCMSQLKLLHGMDSECTIQSFV